MRHAYRPLLGLALLAGLSTLPAQDAAVKETAWTPALSMKFRSVRETALSPDGQTVAFVLREAIMDEKSSEYRSHVWFAAADGGGVRQITRGEKSATSPAFSPDGRWLAFKAARGGSKDKKEGGGGSKSQIWVLPLQGGEAFPVTRAPAGVARFAWCPKGARIAFTMRDPETKEDKKRKKEKRDVILVDKQFKYGHLYLVDVDPAAEKPAEAVRLTGGDFHVRSFDWAPDGQRIVFDHFEDPRVNITFIGGDLSIVTLPSEAALETHRTKHSDAAKGEDEKDEEADSETEDVPLGTVVGLVAGPGAETAPHWSPNGEWIAYASSGERPEPVGLADLWVVPAAGGKPRALAETHNRRVSILGWSGGSDAVFLDERLGTTRHVVTVPLRGETPQQVSQGAGLVGSVSLTPKGDLMAFTWQTTDRPPNVFVSPTAQYTPRKITALHEAVPRPKMGRTELLQWTSKDGMKIEGLLTYPVDHVAGERCPLILSVHGGPAGVYSQGFTGSPGIYMLQYFAQEGFAILRPNPRGSTGYGKEFRYANVKDWGYGDLDDLLAGVDRVIEMGVGDPDRLLLMGWSYGGYMTSFAVTRTDRFKAASMGAGLPNLVSMVTTTDIGDYLAAHMDGEFWNDYETYEKHSAIYRIGKVKTPTQVIHGQKDLRVPFTQGQEFYRALQRKKVPTEMIVYPRTPHGPREPKFLMDVSERILTWFKKHLPEAGQ